MAGSERLGDKTVEELRDEARERGVTGYSDMRKDELVEALSGRGGSGGGAGGGAWSLVRDWIRDRSLGVFFLGLFLLSWIAQLIFQWQVFVDEQREHDSTAEFWSSDFWETFWQSTFENWQSEFLQVAAFTIAAAYLVLKGSSESPDSDERVEAKLDALLESQGLDPRAIEDELPHKFRRHR